MKYLKYPAILILLFLVGVGIAALIQRIPARQFTYSREEPVEIEKEVVGWRVITAYNAVPEQTDSEPCISVSGIDVCKTYKKICASNEFPFGTLLMIGDEIWEVQDQTNSRYNYRIDLL